MRITTVLILLLSAAAVTRADEPAAVPKINDEEHIKPILRDNCFLCHNQNQAKSDLALDNYAAMIRGGASGEVVVPGDPDSSRLYLLVTHQDTPEMPPEKEKLPAETLELIKQWIANGALETSGSVAKIKAKPKLTFSATTGAGKPEGPPPMPEGLSRQPVVELSRGGAPTAMAASPWAPLVALADPHQILLYHSDTGELLGVLPYPEGTPYVLRFSRNGALLLAGGGRSGQSGKVVVFDVKTGTRAFETGDELDAVLAADINEDQTRIALAGPNRIVRIYSTADGTLLHEIKKHTDWVLALEFSPDGVLLATGDRAGNLYVWEAETAREYQTLKGHTAAITGLSWRDDSNVVASASEDASVRLWEMEGGTQVKTWNAHGGIESISFAHDGRLVTAGRDRQVQLWDSAGAPQRTFEAMGDIALRAAITHDGARVVAGDWTGDIRVWNAADGALATRLALNPPTLAKLAEQTSAAAAQAAAMLTQATAEFAAVQAQAQDITARAQAAAIAAAEAKTRADELATQLAQLQQALAAQGEKLKALEATANEAQVRAARAASENEAWEKANNAQASNSP